MSLSPLLTDAQEQLLQNQYGKGSNLDQLVVAKIFDPCGNWSWYLMNQAPEDPDYLWGIVKGFEVEMGSISYQELHDYIGPLCIGLERDLHFKPRPAQEIWNDLLAGKHV